MEKNEIAAVIEHTALKPNVTSLDVEKLIEEASQNGFPVIIIPPCHVRHASKYVQHLQKLGFATLPQIGTVIGFPLGYSATNTKVSEVQEALQWNVTHLDVVLNNCHVQESQHDSIMFELEKIHDACPARDEKKITLKLIIETCNLKNDGQKIAACQYAAEAGFDYVKTSTGFGSHGATVQDVELMKKAIPPWMGIKASGGIKDLATLLKMLEAGANRIGTSSGMAILGECS